MAAEQIILQVPKFSGANIPIKDAARIMGKDPQFVRQAIINRVLDIGVAFKKDGSSTYDYYISPFKFWLATGCVYDAADTDYQSMLEEYI